MSSREIADAIAYFRKERELLDEAITALRRVALRVTKDVDVPGLRLCNRCAELKPVSAFHRNGAYLMSFCRECNTERCRRYYRRNRQRVNAKRRQRERPEFTSP